MSINLRTHRKILLADGRVGFTGGMNIRVGHCLQRQPPNPVQDVHFDRIQLMPDNYLFSEHFEDGSTCRWSGEVGVE